MLWPKHTIFPVPFKNGYFLKKNWYFFFSENYTLSLNEFLQLLVYVSAIQMELQEHKMPISQLRNKQAPTPIRGLEVCRCFYFFKQNL